MSDTDNTIRNQIIFTGLDEAGKQIETLRQQLREIRDARDRAFQSIDKQSSFDGEIKSLQELSELEESTYRKLQKSEAGLAKNIDTRYQKYLDGERKIAEAAEETERRQEAAQSKAYDQWKALEDKKQQAIDDTRAKQNQSSSRQSWADEEAAIKRRTELLKAQWEQRVAQENAMEAERKRQVTGNPRQESQELSRASNLQRAWKQSDLEAVFGTYTSLQTKLRQANLDAQQLYTTMTKTSNVDERLAASTAFSEKRQEISALNKELLSYNKAMGVAAQKTDYLGSLGQKLRSHMNWIIAGGLIAGAFTVPAAIVDGWTKLEESMAGVKQVLNKDGQNLETNAAAANKEMQEFVSIGAKYGETVNDIVDAGRSWGRMYKDVSTVNFLVSQSAKMAVADNFALSESVKGLESAMSQFGMKSQDINEIMLNSNRILDVWTKLSHNAGVSAQDLTAAVERAGSAAHQTGASFEFFNALVASGVRNTARTGAEIGQTLKTVFSSIHSDKAIKELQAMGVEVYKVGADGTKSYRAVQDVLLDVARVTQSTTKDTEALNLAISGGKFQWSKASAIFGDYQQILDNWALAVNSAGFTNEQVAVQMDTLARRVKSLKAELQGFYGGLGTGGMGNALKELVQSNTDFVRGLRENASTVVTFFSVITKAAMGIVLLKTAIQGASFVQGVSIANQRLATGATIESIRADAMKVASSASVTQAIRAESVADGMLAASTKALTSAGAVASVLTGNWVTILAMVAYGIYSVISAQGEESRMQDDLNGKSQKQNDILIAQANNAMQRAQLIHALGDQYNKLSDDIAANSGDTEKNSKTVENQQHVLALLSEALGTNAEAYVKNGKIDMDAIDKLSDAQKKEAQQKIIDDIDKMQSDLKATSDAMNKTQDRIDAMKKEEGAIGILGKAYQWLRRQIAWSDRKVASFYDKMGRHDIAEQQNKEADELDPDNGDTIDSLNSRMDSLRVQKTDDEQGIHDLQAALISLGDQTSPSNSRTVDDTPSKSGKGSANPPMNQTDTLERKEDMLQYNEIMSQRKAIIDQTAEALSRLNAEEKAHGVTDETVAARDKILNNKEWALGQITQQLESVKQQYLNNIGNLADASGGALSVSSADDGTPEGHAMAYFMSQGYSAIDAAGIVGNLISESGLNSNAQSGDGSFGIGQWKDDRLQALYDFAKNNNSDASDYDTQLTFVAWELQNTESAAQNRVDESSPQTPEDAAYGYSKWYERPAWAENPERQENARQVYDKYGDSNAIPYVSGLSDVISPDDWKKLSLPDKQSFVQEHRQQIHNANGLLAELEAATKVQNSVYDTRKLQTETHTQRQDSAFDGINKIIEAAQKNAGENETSQLYNAGLGVTQMQKDSFELQKDDSVLAVMKKEMQKITDKNGQQYKELLQKYQTASMDRDKLKYIQSADDEYTQSNSEIEYEKTLYASSLPRNPSIKQNQDDARMQIEYAERQVTALRQKLEELESSPGGMTSDVYKKTNEELAKALKDLDTLRHAYDDKLKQSEYDLTDDLLLKGDKLRDIWKKLWSELAEDALKALMGIKNNNASLLGQLLGIGKPSNGTTALTSTLLNAFSGKGTGLTQTQSPYTFGINTIASLFHANGGVSDTPAIFGEDGEEVAVPVEKHTENSANLLSYAAKKLGISTPVSVSVSQKTDSTAQAIAGNREHLERLDTMISLTSRQNQMLLHMINNGSGGSNVITQPIVMSQSMSADDFATMYSKAKSLRSIKD